jgi:N-acetylmuramoyl-L-alanine amidase
MRFLLLLAFAGLVQSQCPTIVTRGEWGARAPRSRTNMANPVPLAVVHHGASAACTDRAACIRMMQQYQNLHMDTNGWADIGYNFVVGEDGNVYEGRGWTTVGAHCPAYNSASIGICVIGDFTNRNPNAAAQTAVQRLIQCGVQRGSLPTAYGLRGHRDGCSTACPGNTFYNLLRTWPRFGQLSDNEITKWQELNYPEGYDFGNETSVDSD